jgi:manganese/zinc/iron transport system permease protein
MGIIFMLRKELTVSSFDPVYARVMGLPTRKIYYAHMTGVALATVAAFESVGAILVVAFLIVPPAAARLVSTSVGGMVMASVVFGVFSAVGGLLLAGWIDTSPAGSMAVASGIGFGGAMAVRVIKQATGTRRLEQAG